MTKFIFLTQTADTTTYRGPSGIEYVINIGQPFKVDNKLDIEFFSSKRNNKRFKKSGTAIKIESEDKKFEKELTAIKGISKKTVETIIKVYGNKENLVDDINNGVDLESSISIKQKEILIKTYKEDN